MTEFQLPIPTPERALFLLDRIREYLDMMHGFDKRKLDWIDELKILVKHYDNIVSIVETPLGKRTH